MTTSSYSIDFQNLIQASAKELIEGSFCFGRTFGEWEGIRRFISTAINNDGSILDIGCANGFFLRCLMEWCRPLSLEPFGIDIHASSIISAKSLFPAFANNFIELSIHDLDRLSHAGLPTNYDFVFCSLLSPPHEEPTESAEKQIQTILRHLRQLVRPPLGRLVVALYGRASSMNGSSEQSDEIGRLQRRLNLIQSSGIGFSGVIWNPSGSSHVAAWVDAA